MAVVFSELAAELRVSDVVAEHELAMLVRLHGAALILDEIGVSKNPEVEDLPIQRGDPILSHFGEAAFREAVAARVSIAPADPFEPEPTVPEGSTMTTYALPEEPDVPVLWSTATTVRAVGWTRQYQPRGSVLWTDGERERTWHELLVHEGPLTTVHPNLADLPPTPWSRHGCSVLDADGTVILAVFGGRHPTETRERLAERLIDIINAFAKEARDRA